MNFESRGKGREMGPEKIPTKEAVLAVLEKWAGLEEATIVRELYDEKGLYRLEVSVDGNKPGETTAYEYGRKGVYPEHRSTSTVIDIVYYQDGEPVGGAPLAEFNDGVWTKA